MLTVVSTDSVVHHLLELVCICGANEVALHVVDVTIGVHKVLLVLSFDLDASHDNIVLDVHALLLFFSAFAANSNVGRHLLSTNFEPIEPIFGTLDELRLLVEEIHVLVVLLQVVVGLVMRAVYLHAHVILTIIEILHLKQVVVPPIALLCAFLNLLVISYRGVLWLSIAISCLSGVLEHWGRHCILLGDHIESLALGLKRGELGYWSAQLIELIFVMLQVSIVEWDGVG